MSKHLTRRSINTAMSQTLLESYFNRLAQKKINKETVMYTKFHLIGAVYSNDLPKPMTLEQAKDFIKEFTGLKRLVLEGNNPNVEIY